jgi:hypothetical protein
MLIEANAQADWDIMSALVPVNKPPVLERRYFPHDGEAGIFACDGEPAITSSDMVLPS